MDHENRGKCIIFNHEKFDISFDKREGSSLDASRLQVTFGKLGFDVELHNDFTFTEIKDKINEGKKRYLSHHILYHFVHLYPSFFKFRLHFSCILYTKHKLYFLTIYSIKCQCSIVHVTLQ